MPTLPDMFEQLKGSTANGLRNLAAKLGGAAQQAAASPAGQAATDIGEGVARQSAKAVSTGVEIANQGLRSTAQTVNPGASEYRSWDWPKQEAASRAFDAEYGKAHEAAPEAQAAKKAPYSQNNIRSGPSPEAQAFQKSGAGNPATPSRIAPAAGPSRLSKLGAAGVVAGEALQSYDTMADPASSTTDRVREGARSLIRGGATFLGGAGGAALGSAVPVAGTLAGGLAGGAAGYAAGDYVADKLLGPKKQPTIKSAQAAPVPTGTMPPAVAQQPQADLVDTTRGLRLTPDELMRGTAVPVEGQGAFQRTTPGNRGVATKVGARSDEVKPGTQGGGIRARTPMGVIAEGLSRVKAEQMKEHGIAKEAELGIKAASANAHVAKTRDELRTSADSRLDKQIENEVARGIDPKMDDKQREATTKKAKGELSSRIAHSAANRGLDTSDLTSQQVRQLALANRIRNNVETNWGTLSQGMRDFFGNKRFVSDDLFSYIPEVKDGQLHFGGNVLPVEKIMGGGFNLLANDPTDRDMMELIQEASKRSKKGK